MPEAVVSDARPLSFQAELTESWRRVPNKALFFGLLAAWLTFFHLLGNSTLGYVNTPSLFGWLDWIYDNAPDDSHGRYIPFVVIALFWWKRKEILALPDRHWWPALGLLAGGLLLHFFGFVIQQSQVSLVGFLVGLYGIIGIVWGPHWLRASFFPFLVFAFAVPVQNVIGGITFKLRLVATSITAVMCKGVLGIDVLQDGTRIFDAMRLYEYEVAAACSGIRSLTATLALAVIYAFMMFRSHWRKAVMIAAAVPLAVCANVFRLSTIVIAAEAFGHEAGNYVHESSWLSLLPYVPAILGILLLGKVMSEDKPTSSAPNT